MRRLNNDWRMQNLLYLHLEPLFNAYMDKYYGCANPIYNDTVTLNLFLKHMMENRNGVPKMNGVHKTHTGALSEPENLRIASLTKLKHEWVIWEHCQSLGGKVVKGQTADDYRKDIKEVAEFNSLITFWQLWNSVPHADPTNFFTVEDKSTGKFLRAQFYAGPGFSDARKIIAICVFQKGIDPLWEDPNNCIGGEFSTIKRGCTKVQYKEYWDKLVFLVIGGTFKYSSNITGIRVLDKSAHSETCYKFEVWVNFTQDAGLEKMNVFEKTLGELFDEPISYYTHSV